jgi:O-antigen/teichoic acid export membrane protein
VLLLVNVGLNLVWIPRFGIAGAAASSTAAYGLSLLLMGRYWLRRFPEIRAIDLLRLRTDELRALAGRIKQALRPTRRDVGASTQDAGSA